MIIVDKKMSEEKQAIYINRLGTYLSDLRKYYVDREDPMPIEEARRLTYARAVEIINELKHRINKAELLNYTRSNLNMTEEMRGYFKVKYIENYKEIANFSVDTKNRTATLITELGEEITIEGKIKTADWIDNYGSLFTVLKNAIDSKKKINIFKSNGITMVYIEADDMIKEKYRKGVRYMNAILGLSDLALPIAKAVKGITDVKNFKKILPLIKIKDIELYEELNEYMEEWENTNSVIGTMYLANVRNEGFVPYGDNIELI
jgi:hypothetical protein